MDLYASLSFEGMRNSRHPEASKPAMVGQRKLKDYIFRPPEELYALETDPCRGEQPRGKPRVQGQAFGDEGST